MAAPKGNKYTEKYTSEKAEELLIKAKEYAMSTRDCFSIQEAILHVGLPISTFYNLIKKHDVLEDIKKDIDAIIISKVNKGAILGDFNATACIWRMKQLGETDKQEIEQTNKNIDIPLINFVNGDKQ